MSCPASALWGPCLSAARQSVLLGSRDTKIIDAVHKYGYTQQQIAAHLQLHYSTISNLVRGKT